MAWLPSVTWADFEAINPRSASASAETEYQQIEWVVAGIHCSASLLIETKTIVETRVKEAVANTDLIAFSPLVSRTESYKTIGEGILAISFPYLSKEEYTEWAYAPFSDAGGGTITQTKTTVTRTVSITSYAGEDQAQE